MYNNMNLTMVTFKGKQGEMKGNLVHKRLWATWQRNPRSWCLWYGA